MLGEDNNVKDTTLLLQLAILIIIAHTNADYNSLCFCSDPKGKDTKVQYQLMICVLQLLFAHAFTGCDTTSRTFDVELVRRQYSKTLSKMIKYYRHVQSLYCATTCS